MPYIPQEIIDQVVNNADIVTVISKYLDIKKKGKNFLAVCPFHNDSSPSLNISPEKKIYHCFSCNAGGGVIGFVQNFEKISFPMAVIKLANTLGVKIAQVNSNTFRSKYSKKEERIFEVNKLAFTFFQNNLFSKNGIAAFDYIKMRKISDEAVDKFMIGYCSKFSEFIPFMLKNNVSYEELMEYGLIKKTENNYFSIFEQRLIFTLKNEDSKIVGFSGRVIEKNSNLAKYLNSCETLVFKKSELIYNLCDAVNYIRIENHIILVEGYMDVISLNKLKIYNVVAIMGTKFSNSHMNKLKKITKNIVLFLDGDDPGVQASLAVAKLLVENSFNVKIVNNKTELDPGDLTNFKPSSEILEIIKKPIESYYYFLEKFKSNIFENSELLKTIYILIYFDKQGEFANRNYKKIINNIASLYSENKDDLWEEFSNYTNKIKHLTLPTTSALSKKSKKDENNLNNDSYQSTNYFLDDVEEPNFNLKHDNIIQSPIINNEEQNINRNNKQIIFNLKKEYGIKIFDIECRLLLGMSKSRKVNDFYKSNIVKLNIPLFSLIADNITLWYNANIDSCSLNIADYQNGNKIYSDIINQLMSSFLLQKPQSLKTLIEYKNIIHNYQEVIKIGLLKSDLKKTSDFNNQLKISEKIISLSKNIKGDF